VLSDAGLRRRRQGEPFYLGHALETRNASAECVPEETPVIGKFSEGEFKIGALDRQASTAVAVDPPTGTSTSTTRAWLPSLTQAARWSSASAR